MLNMTRVTVDQQEIRYLQATDDQLHEVAARNRWRVKVALRDGTTITGYLAGVNTGRTQDQQGQWGYYGEATIQQDKINVPRTVDRLDIESVEDPA